MAAHKARSGGGLTTFYLLLITQTFSLIGSRASGVAVGIWLYQTTGDTFPLLAAAFFAELPGMFMGSFTGWIADRYNRRVVIAVGDMGQALGTLFLLSVVANNTFELWHLYAVMFVQGVFSLLQTPASSAVITQLVPENQRDRANGLKEVGFNLAGVIAPSIVGVLYLIAGLIGVMLLDLVTFIGAIVVVLLLPIPPVEQSELGAELRGNFWAELFGGWRLLWRYQGLFWLVIYIAFVFFLINGPLTLDIPYFSTQTQDETTLGLLLALSSAGALAGSVWIASIGPVKRRVRFLLLAYTWLGVMLLFLGTLRTPLGLGMAFFLLMIPLPAGGAVFAGLIQAKIPPDVQGRMFAVTDQIFMLTTPLSFLMTGWLVDNVLEPAVTTPAWGVVAPLVGNQAGSGMGLLLFSVGVIILLATFIAALQTHIRNLETDLPNYS